MLVGDVSGHRNQIARWEHGIFSPVTALAIKYRYALAAGNILRPPARSSRALEDQAYVAMFGSDVRSLQCPTPAERDIPGNRRAWVPLHR